tara:strand:- start:15088 stop:15633 length:546 start_codon:yes stop_codon:yes gene_type:complete
MPGIFQVNKWLAVPVLLIIFHAITVWRNTLVQDNNAARSTTAEQFSTGSRGQAVAEQQTGAFSLLFGVQPELQTSGEDENAIDPQYLRLTDIGPRLLAVDEVNNTLTARLWFPEEHAPRLRKAMQGDTFYHYQVSDVSLAAIYFQFSPTIEHNWPDDTPEQLILHLFKPIEAATNTTNGPE